MEEACAGKQPPGGCCRHGRVEGETKRFLQQSSGVEWTQNGSGDIAGPEALPGHSKQAGVLDLQATDKDLFFSWNGPGTSFWRGRFSAARRGRDARQETEWAPGLLCVVVTEKAALGRRREPARRGTKELSIEKLPRGEGGGIRKRLPGLPGIARFEERGAGQDEAREPTAGLRRVGGKRSDHTMGESGVSRGKMYTGIVTGLHALCFGAHHDSRGMHGIARQNRNSIDSPFARRGTCPAFAGIARDPQTFRGTGIENARVGRILHEGLGAPRGVRNALELGPL